MVGSFIQSHWPCMTLWPISMFSRILATDSPAVPSTHAGLYLEKISTSARQRAEAPVQRDHAADVARVALAEVGFTSSCSSSKSLPISSSCCVAELVQRVVRRRRAWDRPPQRSISTWPSGALMQVRTIWPLASVDRAGAQVADGAVLQPADAGVADAHPAAERQRRAGVLAADQDRHAGVALGLAVGDPEATVPPSPSPPPMPMTGWNRSVCRCSARSAFS